MWAPKEIDIDSWDKSFLQHYSIVAEESDVIIGFGDLDATDILIDYMFIRIIKVLV